MDFKDAIALELKKITKKDIALEVPPDSSLGDYAFPCFELSQDMKKSPVEIAKELASQLKIKGVTEIKATGPYVNFFIDKKVLAQQTLAQISKEKNKYGSKVYSKEKVMVEFSQANTHKAFHVGHIRGTSLGESIARILEFCGNKTIRANYQGDTGMHVAKWIWCYQKYHSKEKLQKNEAWIASIYVDAVKRLTEDEDLQEEVYDLNKQLDEGKDKELIKFWKETRKDSLDAFEVIYKELNTHFDEYFFESEIEGRAKEIVDVLLKKGIAEISEGATIINMEEWKLGVWVLLRKDGTALYSAKDLALAETKFEKHQIDKAVYVVGAAQRQHVMQIFKTLELMKFKQAKNCHYVPISEVRLPGKKMASRTGDNILYSDFKKELLEHATKEIKKRYTLSSKELDERALAVSIASMKYAMLKQDTNKGITFDMKEALRFEGDTGPYLLYSYARAKSILAKAKFKEKKYDVVLDGEEALVTQLSSFSDIVYSAYSRLSPHIIANYANDLAQTFNEFYHNSKVIGSETEQFRLELVSAFAQVLKNALNLLGIDVLERM